MAGSDMKHLIKALTPPILANYMREALGRCVRFEGIYDTWQEATAHAEGYDADEIISRVREATRKVLRGESACERDSVLFDKTPYPFPLIAVLLRAAVERNGRLTVLDFGGALGSSYYQCRDFLGGVGTLRWCIVEQPKFVQTGKLEFENDVVRFFETIEQCETSEIVDVVLISGVLHYLEKPREILARLSNVGARYVVVDRTPFSLNGREMITVQQVPRRTIRSSYPTRLLGERFLQENLGAVYKEIAEFDAVDGEIGRGRLRARSKGFVFQRVG